MTQLTTEQTEVLKNTMSKWEYPMLKTNQPMNKIYLVVEDYDYGPGYNIGNIHGAYSSRTKAEEVATKMDKDYKSNMSTDDPDRNRTWFHVYHKEFVLGDDT